MNGCARVNRVRHKGCADVLRAGIGYEVTVSTAPPLVETPYTYVDGKPCAFTCPHGVTYYLEPTSDQIAKWAEEGVR